MVTSQVNIGRRQTRRVEWVFGLETRNQLETRHGGFVLSGLDIVNIIERFRYPILMKFFQKESKIYWSAHFYLITTKSHIYLVLILLDLCPLIIPYYLRAWFANHFSQTDMWPLPPHNPLVLRAWCTFCLCGHGLTNYSRALQLLVMIVISLLLQSYSISRVMCTRMVIAVWFVITLLISVLRLSFFLSLSSCLLSEDWYW